jgi:hypothetical protein
LWQISLERGPRKDGGAIRSGVKKTHLVARVDHATDSPIGRVLKNALKPHRRQPWVIPPKANSAFVAAMEDVLAVYTRPRDPDCPLPG